MKIFIESEYVNIESNLRLEYYILIYIMCIEKIVPKHDISPLKNEIFGHSLDVNRYLSGLLKEKPNYKASLLVIIYKVLFLHEIKFTLNTKIYNLNGFYLNQQHNKAF